MQTPAPFEYERATSVEGAIAALERLGSDARIIAGGHSLLPMMKLRLANPSHLIDINDLAELSYVREHDGEIRIGALTRHVDLLKSQLLAQHFPIFADAETVIADPVVRNRGTIGGSLCQADAAEDLSAVCSALKAEVVIRGAGGERVVGMEDFHVGPFTTAVGAGELLTEVRLRVRPGAGSAHEKVERRAGDWAIAAASAAVWTEGGTLADVGVALSAVGMEDFHVGPFTTAVGAGELLTEIRLRVRPGAGSAHDKVERRAGDWAIAAASAAVWTEGGTLADVGIALSAVGMTTIHLARAEELMRGRPPSDELFAQAGEIASEDCSPSADGRGPIDYKRHLAGVLTGRALRRAAQRAAGSGIKEPAS